MRYILNIGAKVLLAVVALSVLVGTVLGLTAGYFRGLFEIAVVI